MVSWYDALDYCNKRSIQEGLKPYYNIIKNKKDFNKQSEYGNLKWTVTRSIQDLRETDCRQK
ncbi:hypothetical protein [Bacillus halotolerans]|uniref:hypothetical protein n=1 Tax=Bacillus halotolerans TaxID=260554 RepID=UPI002DBECC63|nr:hypothetical protein [Bacillus halotolerans]MEC1546426.1 hypothetical protein [Bacillus halotolerans]